jgi:hypothetical protein
MAISFSDWYKAYANQPGMGGTSLSDPVLERLSKNLTNPGFESNFQSLLTRLGNVGTSANSKRNLMANETKTAAFDRGLSDETSVEELDRRAGNAGLGTKDAVTYKIKMGPDGRAYRQAYLNTSANFGARGWGGSEEKASQWRARQDLNTQRDSLTNNLTTGQNDSILNQGRDEGDVIDGLAKNVTDYAEWKVDPKNMPQSPGGGDGGSGSGGGTPDPNSGQPAAPAATDYFRGIAVGGTLGTYAFDPKRSTLNNVYRVKGGGDYKVVKRGNKYVVIRTK